MIVERSMREDYLSNTYLVAAAEGGEAFFVDAGGPVAPLISKADELNLTPTHVLLTHRHGDHVEELGELLERWPDLQVLAHPDEEVLGVTGTMGADETIEAGGLDGEREALRRERDPQLHRNGGTEGQAGQRVLEAAIAQHRGMEAVCEIAQLGQSSPQLGEHVVERVA